MHVIKSIIFVFLHDVCKKCVVVVSYIICYATAPELTALLDEMVT